MHHDAVAEQLRTILKTLTQCHSTNITPKFKKMGSIWRNLNVLIYNQNRIRNSSLFDFQSLQSHLALEIRNINRHYRTVNDTLTEQSVLLGEIAETCSNDEELAPYHNQATSLVSRYTTSVENTLADIELLTSKLEELSDARPSSLKHKLVDDTYKESSINSTEVWSNPYI